MLRLVPADVKNVESNFVVEPCGSRPILTGSTTDDHVDEGNEQPANRSMSAVDLALQSSYEEDMN